MIDAHTIQIKIRLFTFHKPQFKLLPIFEKVIFQITSIVTLTKIVKKKSCKSFKHLQL